MFPIRDHNPSGRTPYVTYALIAINVVVFLAYWPALSGDFRELMMFYYDWGVTPVLITQNGDYATLFTSMFLHGGWMHLAGNMLFLWVFGDNLEDEMGHLPYLAFYTAAGVAAALAEVAAAPLSQVPTVGASGAIAGVMGGYLLLFPRAKVDVLIIIIFLFYIIPVPAWIVLGLWMIMQLFGGLSAVPEAGGVAYWAHAGGFAAGAVLTLPLFLRLGGPRFWDRTHGRPPHPEARYELARTRIPKVRRK
ncbi:rhomboid family intramembrane serine protease [Roseovarius spongiae]|uniref:Rhomboid family intramembrane serine protease n=1 Tax=Roseovarius spongiae TaxID=2320272 RepID=A0A3A8ASK3_9RHOB|nr:rhomboid family intramembrane serine protease [Roseovarius spongiae]RKF14142.1 rhomboid family intramembrane serine protease [Roseovarius spongiae]